MGTFALPPTEGFEVRGVLFLWTLRLRPPPREFLERGPPHSLRLALKKFDDKAEQSMKSAERLTDELGFHPPSESSAIRVRNKGFSSVAAERQGLLPRLDKAVSCVTRGANRHSRSSISSRKNAADHESG